MNQTPKILSDRWFATRRRLIGLVFLVAFALAIWLSLALYHQRFTPVALVTLNTASVGNEMHPGAEVMVRGVPVGQVRRVSADGHGARLVLAIQPRMAARLPVNVTAQLLPVTLFGAREVDLMLPRQPAAAHLTSGSVIRQDQSADAVEVEQVLNNLLPLLNATQPQELSLTLTAMAKGLNGRGTEVGQTLTQLGTYVKRLRPELPALDRDISELIKVSKTYTQAAPDIVRALRDFSVVSRTVAQQQANLAALFSDVTTASQNLRSFLRANSPNIIKLSSVSTATLQRLARYSPEFPCTLHALVAFEPKVSKVLGAGTRQPGLHVHVDVVPSLGKYRPGVNTPVYRDDLGPHCYSVPFRGISLDDGASPRVLPRSKSNSSGVTGPGRQTAATKTTARPGALAETASLTSPANSGAENELVNELAGLSLGRRPASLPGWSSLLVGPLYRGAAVTVR